MKADSNAIETITKYVYGETFARYDRQEFLEFLRPLEIRLEANEISKDSFQGRRCLDAGCGGGRGSVLMGQAGADEVISYDLAETNVATTAQIAKLFDLNNVHTTCGSLLELPFPDESFDVVWCNGVLHHTVDPDQALQEVTRVLKVGGRMWLYLYGSGGLYWYMVDFIRNWLSDLDPAETLLTLSLLNTPTGRIAEFIDDWHVPVLNRYTDADVSNRLCELGFAAPRRLFGGTSYDTSQRLKDHDEASILGEGDLRYWVEKTSQPSGQNEHVLPDVDGKGSHYDDTAEVTAFAEDFNHLVSRADELTAVFSNLKQVARVAFASRLQTKIRDEFSLHEKFDVDSFRAYIRTISGGEEDDGTKQAVAA